ncbi:MAG: hypothetical protein EOP47_26115 [Sphingobacteriaceae bacterium]|nr:MAG: hypothetical protein EOP47_26115 [Sphingobacteriaceae bacterium]
METKEKDEHSLAKGNQINEQKKPDNERVKTVTPDNDSGDPGPPVEERISNKGQGPKGENL